MSRFHLACEPVLATIGLGANLGDPVVTLRQATKSIALMPDTSLRAVSALYGSKPVAAQGPDFVNAVVQVVTTLSAESLLQHLQGLEQEAGRERPYLNAPRTLDLDLLLYGKTQINTPTLTVPHPRMHERAFVLIPLAEIAPAWESSARTVGALPGQQVWRIGSLDVDF